MRLLQGHLYIVEKTCSQVAIRWLLQKDVVPSVIVGVTSSKQLKDNLGANGWALSKDQVMRIYTALRKFGIATVD